MMSPFAKPKKKAGPRKYRHGARDLNEECERDAMTPTAQSLAACRAVAS